MIFKKNWQSFYGMLYHVVLLMKSQYIAHVCIHDVWHFWKILVGWLKKIIIEPQAFL